MSTFFDNLFTASFHGSIIIAAVILLRLALRKAPRKYVCMLWLLAGLRLLMPFEIQSDLSLQPEANSVSQIRSAVSESWQGESGRVSVEAAEAAEAEPETAAAYTGSADTAAVTAATADAAQAAQTAQEVQAVQPVSAEPAGTGAVQAETETQTTSAQGSALAALKLAFPVVYFLVAGCFVAYSLITYISLRRRVQDAIRVRGGWESDRIETAFILGFIRPKIYIPMGMSRQTRRYILAHERTHLEKGDHWIKMVGFLALALHWFNPLVWVAYTLLCKDIEIACDERVVRFMEVEERKAYSAALLKCSTNQVHFAACPVAFGEVSVRYRIKSVLNYRKPQFWISALAVLAVAFVAVCLLTSPKDSGDSTIQSVAEETTEGETAAGETAHTVSANTGHDISDLQEYEEYTDPYGNYLYVSARVDDSRNPSEITYYVSVDTDVYSWSETEQQQFLASVLISNEYWIDEETDGTWEALPILAETAEDEGTVSLGSNGYVSDVVNFSERYGNLYDGHYRIGKGISVYGEQYTYYAEFYIDANDPAADPEIVEAITRANDAVSEVQGRSFYRLAIEITNDIEGEQDTVQIDLLVSGDDILSDYKSWNLDGNLTRSTGIAVCSGSSYRELDGVWYNMEDSDPFIEGSYILDNMEIANQKVSFADAESSASTEKLSFVIDIRGYTGNSYLRDYRSYRDYYFNVDGKLTQINNTQYYYLNGTLNKIEMKIEICAATEAEVSGTIQEIPEKAGNTTYEQYEQASREKNFDEDFMLGSGQFLWSFGGWKFYVGGTDASATGITVNREYISGSGTLRTEGAYWIEKLDNGTWSRVSMMAGGTQPDGSAVDVFGGNSSVTIDWSSSYGTLEPGFYRLGQTYINDAGETKACYAKFRVYDSEMEENLKIVRDGMEAMWDRDTVKITQLEYLTENDSSHYYNTTTWKQGSNYSSYWYDLLDNAEDYYLYIGGQGYSLGRDESGWTSIGYLDSDWFALFLSMDFEFYDSYVSSATREGNTITVISDIDTTIPQRFVFQVDGEGNILSGQRYDTRSGEEALWTEFTVTEPTQDELENAFDMDRITQPASFSYAEDQAMFAYQQVSEGPFQNTQAVTITTAQEAVERAKLDCTLLPWEDEDGNVNEGGYNITQAFYDSDAQMWRVEFTFSQGGVYQAVYMTADGITTQVVTP